MNNMKISTIVLVAGNNSRLHLDYPKCLYPIIRRPMLSYLLDSIYSFSKIILVVKYKENLFRDFVNNYDKNTNISVVTQKENLGTFSAVSSGFSICEDSDIIVIVPGDKPLITKTILTGLIEKHINTKAEMTLLTTYDRNNTEYLRIDQTNPTTLKNYSDLNVYEKLSLELYTSIICINRTTLSDVFNHQFDNLSSSSDLSIKDIVNFVLNKKYKVSTYYTKDAFMCYGVNNFYDLSMVENYLRMETNKLHMQNGVCLINPETITISNEVKIESGVTIYPNTYITGITYIGKNSIIGPNTEIHNVNIGSDNIIKHSLIYDSKIGDNCKIGPFAHLRMNNVLSNNIRIGNFVEIKSSKIGDDTKAAHLSYCGDSTIGKNVNVGCGTITVNYDGKNKYQTKIGDNVFLGCNSNLIAPIVIEDNALIAAGSTIYENVPKNSLSIARTYQINKEGYALKYPHIKKHID